MSFVQGRCTVALCKSGLRRVDLHNRQETAAPFANNGTVMAEEYNPNLTNYCTRHFLAAICTDGNILKCNVSRDSVVHVTNMSSRQMFL